MVDESGVMQQFTKKESIAIAAMQGLLTACDPEKEVDYIYVAQTSVRCANALMREMDIQEEALHITPLKKGKTIFNINGTE